jgi:hypothetical protein
MRGRRELTLRWDACFPADMSFRLLEWDVPPEVLGHFRATADCASHGRGLGGAIRSLLRGLPDHDQRALLAEVMAAAGELVVEQGRDGLDVDDAVEEDSAIPRG